MGIVSNIKLNFAVKALNKDLKKSKDRKVKGCDISHAKSVAFLLDITDQSDLTKLLKVVQYFKSEFGIKIVFAFSYFNEKNIPDYLKSSVNFDFIAKKDLDWRGVPSGTAYNNFIEEKFDLLIDLSTKSSVPLKFALLHSNAKFKIGRYSEENVSFYDLMIEFKSEDLEEYVNQVVHYLNMMNPS